MELGLRFAALLVVKLLVIKKITPETSKMDGANWRENYAKNCEMMRIVESI